ncbi:MAG: NAD(P)/FAD-dependent oxidoreductase [Myxococcales bacterium]|nr:NAD(P)/FAD-dependent oxidoreductase [Myxococcales bacterium]
MPERDILIVGGGPAGVSTALFFVAAAPELAERLLLIDKARFPREKICAGAIGARAERALAGIGVAITVPSVEVSGLSVATPSARLAVDGGEIIGRVVRRRELDHALLDEVRRRGVEVREGVRTLGVEATPGGAVCHTSEGPRTARAVVGADGVGSVVRRSLPQGEGIFHAQAVEVDTPRVASDGDERHLHFELADPHYPGYAWDFPTLVDGERLVCRGIYQLTRGVSSTGPDVATLLAARLRRQGLDPARYRVRRFAERGLPRHQPLAGPGVLLVGEAAGIDPALGEGIAQAILYGEVAGRYLAEAVTRSDFTFADYPERVRRSRVGLDLRIRRAATPWIYGAQRPLVERWVSRSQALARAGMAYFAGRRVPRGELLRAALDLGAALVE